MCVDCGDRGECGDRGDCVNVGERGDDICVGLCVLSESVFDLDRGGDAILCRRSWSNACSYARPVCMCVCMYDVCVCVRVRVVCGMSACCVRIVYMLVCVCVHVVCGMSACCVRIV